jgi:penicillin-binding protein 1B
MQMPSFFSRFRMPSFSRLPQRRTVFKVLSISLITLFVLFGALTLYVYKQSVGKFEIRRLSLPTRIYADYTPLRPGLLMQPDDLLEKLKRLGYREATVLAQPGDFIAGKSDLSFFARAFKHPTREYEAQKLRVTFKNGAIESVTTLPGGGEPANAALEPELLTSILSDQLENRRPVTLDQVPQHLQDAVIVTEDVRFWHHPGVDPLGILRAVLRNVKAGGVSEGGSTLTQQLVKNYYLTNERTFKRKITEAFMAVVLDARYSKKEILEAYLNDIYLGRNRSISILGVGEAARYYFGKPVSEITPAESALLAAMVRGANNYSPFTKPERALERRNLVLGLMLKNNKLKQDEYDRAIATPLPKKPFREKSGLASIPFYVDRVLQEMATDYGIKDVKGRGLAIYTAIDLNAQDTASRTLDGGLTTLEKNNRRLRRSGNPLQGVMIHVDVATGEIRALVGGRNYDQSQFNRALSSKRQVGSLFKPFVYLTAFEPSLSHQNITPATLVDDTRFIVKRRFGADWSPRNYEDRYHGVVTVRQALEQSMNAASVRIGLTCTIPPIIRTAKTLGVDAEIDDSNPSVILGAVDIPPIEMAAAYSTIARTGSRLPLRAVRFVMDDRGNVVSNGDVVKPTQVFPARDVFILQNVMEGVVDRGTAAAVHGMGFKPRTAGKTGTTNDTRDVWFIGFTPRTLALTWIGFDDNKETGLSGGTGAVPIWTRYMNAIAGAEPVTEFPVPEGITFAEVDETSGGLSTPKCPPNAIVNEAFKSGTEPHVPCPKHSDAPVMAPPIGVPLDEFGNPIVMDTTDTMPPTDTAAGEPQLGGGIFKTDTAPVPPPPAPSTAEPPPVDRTEPRPARPPATAPEPGNTTTTAPPPSTNTSSTAPPG